MHRMPHAGCVCVALPSLPHSLQSTQADEAPGQTAYRIFKGIFDSGSILPVSLTPGTSAAQ